MFAEDSRSERFLDEQGGKYHYDVDRLGYQDLKPDWENDNQGRSEPKVPGAIQEYAILMDKGSVAPAPILWKNPKRTDGKYDVLDGIQRLLAAESRNTTTFNAYVLDEAPDSLALKIRVFANIRLQGGYQESAELTLDRAVKLLINTGKMSIQEVANMGGWLASTIRLKKQAVDVGNAVSHIGGPKLPDTILHIVAKESKLEHFEKAAPVLANFFGDIKQMRLSAVEAEPYIQSFFTIKCKGSVFDQFTRNLREFREDDEVAARLADPTRKRFQTLTPEGKIQKALKGAHTTIDKVLQSEAIVTEMAEYFQITNQIKCLLTQIQRRSKGKKK